VMAKTVVIIGFCLLPPRSVSMRLPESTPGLFIEQIVEGTPCIFDRVGTGRGLALHALAQGKPRAIVVQILLWITGHVQPALEPATRIELHALLAGMQGSGALRALLIRAAR